MDRCLSDSAEDGDEGCDTVRGPLRWLLGLLGGVACVAGTDGVVRGSRGVLRRVGSEPDASIDSELRFFAAWYVVAGALMARAAQAPERDAATVRVVAVGWIAAALGRVLSLRAVGRPHPLYTGLLAAEVTIPVLLLRWLRAVETS